MRARIVFIGLSVVLVLAAAACAPGTPDLGYSPSGAVPYGSATATTDGLLQLVPQSDGGVIATRGSRPLTRIGTDGVVDPAWGSTLPTDCRRTGRAMASGANVVVTCGRLAPPSGPPVWQVWRVTAAGLLDPTFGGGDGIVDVAPDLGEFDLAPLPNGGYLGLGHAIAVPQLDSVTPLVAIVYSANGTATSRTTINIPVTTAPPEFAGWRIDASLTPTVSGVLASERVSTILIANGFEVSASRIQRFDADGIAVNEPGFGGPSSGEALGSEAITGVVGLSLGRVAEVGTLTVVNLSSHRSLVQSFIRVTQADGSPDPGFGVGGRVDLQMPTGGRLQPDAVALTTGTGFLVVVGTPPTGGPVVTRYDTGTGARDLTFGNGGTFPVFLARAESAVARAGAQQVYVGGFDSAGRPSVSRIWNHTTS